MSFIKNFIEKNVQRHREKHTKPSMMVMESNTLGMTVIEESSEDVHIIQELTVEEWVDILGNGKLDGVPYNRLYFSFLKGLPTFLRMKVWLLLCTENSSRNYTFSGLEEKKMSQQFREEKQKAQGNKEQGIFSIFTLELFQKLVTSQPTPKESEQIEKDIRRTYSNKTEHKYTEPLMRRILYALSNSGVEYSQGMNYILLYVIIFCLESLGVTEQSFPNLNPESQRNIFIILREIVLRLESVFDSSSIFGVLKELEERISQSMPDVFFNIHKLGMDTYSLFAQNYYSLLTYSNPPDPLTRHMIDLFFLEGPRAITALIVRMMEISQDEILKIKEPERLQRFIKSEMFHFCFRTLEEEKKNARSISDFGLSFYNNVDEV